MIYDCFQFFNELDILKIRLEVMNPIVDKFVISEATETFSGLKKPLYYEENKELFSEFQDKIIHVVVEDTPEGDTHYRDTFQKNAVTRGLKDCKDDDIVIFEHIGDVYLADGNKELAKKYYKLGLAKKNDKLSGDELKSIERMEDKLEDL